MSNDAQAPDATVEPQKCCGNCVHARERLGSTVHIVCKCYSSPEWGCIMEHVETCDHFDGVDE